MSTSCSNLLVFNNKSLFPTTQVLCPGPAPMDQASDPVPPAGFAEYLAFLVQNGSIPSFPASQPPQQRAAPLLTTPDTPAPPTQHRFFTWANHGTGGALSDKQKVSKEITASATKHKSQIDPDAETQLSPTSGAAKSSSQKQTKRAKTTAKKVST